MRDSEPVQIDEKRHQLLKAKFGWLLNWSKPAIQKTIGPYDMEPFDTFDTHRQAVIALCQAELLTFTDAEVEHLLDRDKPDPENHRHAWKSLAHDQIARLDNVSLPWFAAGFGHPGFRADIEYWSKMAHFLIEELACLSVGVDPQKFDSFKLDQPPRRGTEFRPAQQFLQKRLEQLRREFAPFGQRARVSPRQFIAWVDRVSFEVEPEFLSQLRKCNLPASQPDLDDAKPTKPDKREVNSMAQLITAMAIDGYGYSPGAPRSPIPREIANLAASMGMKISEDTIRKYLKIGAEFIPEGWEPNRR